MARRRHRRRSPGLPRAVERRIVHHLSDTALGRIEAAAAIRALGVLVRRHPGAAADALGAGLVHAGRAGVAELRRRLDEPRATPAPRPARLTGKDRRRLIRALKRDARGPGDAPSPPDVASP